MAEERHLWVSLPACLRDKWTRSPERWLTWGTSHLRGFLNLRTKKRLSGVKELISARAHCEVARGTDADNPG